MGAGLLVDVVEEILLVAAAFVVDGLLAAGGEVLDGRVGRDTILLGDSLALGRVGVDLGDQDVGVSREVGGDRLPCRSELLAVCDPLLALYRPLDSGKLTATPWCSKGNESSLITTNSLAKGLIRQQLNIARHLELLL